MKRREEEVQFALSLKVVLCFYFNKIVIYLILNTAYFRAVNVAHFEEFTNV